MFEELKAQDEEPEKQRFPSYTGVLIAALTLPVLILFDYMGKYYIGLSVAICLGMNIFAVILRWKLKNFVWFWIVVVIAVAIEIPLLLLIPWQQITVNRIELLPIGFGAFVFTLGVMKIAESVMAKPSHSHENQ
ncbi:MAG TPA: hypothetical protein VGR64_05385 [Terracidiphilus sp.]|nr:hypothetical protein [Terracidiphilus sp.]